MMADERKGVGATQPKPDCSVCFVKGAKSCDLSSAVKTMLRSGDLFEKLSISFLKDTGEYSFVTPDFSEFSELKKLLTDVNSNLSCLLNGGTPPATPFHLVIKREAYDPLRTIVVFIPLILKEMISNTEALTKLLNKNPAYHEELTTCSVFVSREKGHTGVAAISFKTPEFVDCIVNRGSIVVQSDGGKEFFLRARRYTAQRSQPLPRANHAAAPIWNVKKRTAQSVVQPVVFAANDSLSFMKECIEMQADCLERMKEQYVIRERQERMHQMLLNNPLFLSDVSKILEENHTLRSLCQESKINVPVRSGCSEATKKLLADSSICAAPTSFAPVSLSVLSANTSPPFPTSVQLLPPPMCASPSVLVPNHPLLSTPALSALPQPQISSPPQQHAHDSSPQPLPTRVQTTTSPYTTQNSIADGKNEKDTDEALINATLIAEKNAENKKKPSEPKDPKTGKRTRKQTNQSTQ